MNPNFTAYYYLEVVVALHVVLGHAAADLDGVALPEAVVRALDLLRHQRVKLQCGTKPGANLVLVLVKVDEVFSPLSNLHHLCST